MGSLGSGPGAGIHSREEGSHALGGEMGRPHTRGLIHTEDTPVPKQLLPILATLAVLAAVPASAKQRAYAGPDYSGVYDCTGDDSHEGKYAGVVTLKLVREQSTGPYGAYSFTLEVPGFGTYSGQAAARGRQMGIHFALADQAAKDYGTGIAEFSHKGGKWSFRKYYYEPEYKGGNFGTEHCVKR